MGSAPPDRGFGYIGMPDIIRGLRHVVLYETFKETMPHPLDHLLDIIMSNCFNMQNERN